MEYIIDFNIEPISEPSNFISILTACQVMAYPVLGFPTSGNVVSKKLVTGEFMQVTEACIVKALKFYKAIDGYWICEKPKGAKQPFVELVSLERYSWAYVCNDKDGATLRDTPTRVKSHKEGTKLKHQDRVHSIEKVTFPSSGDTFIHLAAPRWGWVPVTKVNGKEKMQALEEVEAGEGEFSGVLAAKLGSPVNDSLDHSYMQSMNELGPIEGGRTSTCSGSSAGSSSPADPPPLPPPQDDPPLDTAQSIKSSDATPQIDAAKE